MKGCGSKLNAILMCDEQKRGQMSKSSFKCLFFTFKKRFHVPIALAFGLLVMLFFYKSSWNSKPTIIKQQVVSSNIPRNLGNLVETPFCEIPKFDPMDASVRHALRKLKPLECGKNPLTYVIGDMLFLNESNIYIYGVNDSRKIRCCFRELKLKKSRIEATISENFTYFGTSTHFTSEFIQVECFSAKEKSIYKDFHYSIPLKPDVEKRCTKIMNGGENKENNSSINDTNDGNPKFERYSVAIIGFDGTSRLNVERYLPKTRNYILKVLQGVEMKGYTKVGDNTFPNLVPLYTGLTVNELKKQCFKNGNFDNSFMDNCTWIWKRFTEIGYRTMYSEDQPNIETFFFQKKGFAEAPTDYFLRPLIREAFRTIVHQLEDGISLCFGNRPQFEMPTSWVFDMMKRFSGAAYFNMMWSNGLTHGEVNNLQRADDYLLKKLRDAHDGGHLNHTFIILLSDHGMRWGNLRATSIGRYEERLPALYIIPPPGFREAHPHKYSMLIKNSIRLTTPFDLHVTLKNIAEMERPSSSNKKEDIFAKGKAVRGLSLFKEVPLDRTCKSAGIDLAWCTCAKSISIDTTTKLVQLAAMKVVDKVVEETNKFRDKCEVFTLDWVIGALQETAKMSNQTESTKKEESLSVYHVVVRVQPGDALFEGTVLSNMDGTRQHVDGSISRLSVYSTQAKCLDDWDKKKFCYCIN